MSNNAIERAAAPISTPGRILDVVMEAYAITVVASPFDFTKVPLLAPVRMVANLTGGHALSPAIYLWPEPVML